MGEPISIVSGAAGIVSLGLTVCSGLLQYYGSWKDSPTDVLAMCESLEALTKTFQLLDEKVRHPLLDHECVERVTESIISCAAGVQKLQSKLDKMRNVKPGVSAHLQRALYPFRQKTLVSLVQTISDLRNNLILATSTLQLDISITSFHCLHELDKRMENLVDSTEASTIKVLDGITKLYVNQEQEKLRSMSMEDLDAIHWLSPLDFTAKQNDALSRRQHGTGRWLLESPEFRSWSNTAGNVLWCPGIRKSLPHSSLVRFLFRTENLTSPLKFENPESKSVSIARKIWSTACSTYIKA
jgi:ankyrin repeat domain-containing protein 50